MPPPYARGHVRASNKDQLMALSQRHYAAEIAQLPLAMEASWDSRTMGWVGPVKDQSQCGSCWDFSGTGVVEIAYNKAGLGGGPDVFILSEQYTLDCGRSGGCGGDDNVTVLQEAKAGGIPLTKDYGPYGAHSGRCHFAQTMTLYKLDDWGFVDGAGGNGVTDTDLIKKAIKAYGCVGSAVAATGSWDGWTSDPNYVHKGNSRSIDHDVIIIGWDDAKGAWLMRNSWSPSWAWNGYGWIAYGADSIGTEAVWGTIRNPVVPPIDWGTV